MFIPNVVHKVTTGFVVQTYTDGVCTSQNFVAGDDVSIEDDDGNPIDLDCELPYQQFDMVQPEKQS